MQVSAKIVLQNITNPITTILYANYPTDWGSFFIASTATAIVYAAFIIDYTLFT